jgi:arylsulfatase A-like enzyme
MEQCAMTVVRDERYKYVHFAAPPSVIPPLLFDLVADPGQTADLAADPAYAGIRAEYAELMLRWRVTHLDRTLTGHFCGPGGLSVRRDPRV